VEKPDLRVAPTDWAASVNKVPNISQDCVAYIKVLLDP